MAVDLDIDYHAMASRLNAQDASSLGDMGPNILSDAMRVSSVASLISPEKPEKPMSEGTGSVAGESTASAADDFVTPEKKQVLHATRVRKERHQ